MANVAQSRDLFSGILPYDPANFDDYVFAFKNKMTLQNHHNILNGTEIRPPPTPSTATEEEAARLRKLRKKFETRNTTICRAIVDSITKASHRYPAEVKTALAAVRSAPENDGLACWTALLKHHNDASLQNKIQACNDLNAIMSSITFAMTFNMTNNYSQ